MGQPLYLALRYRRLFARTTRDASNHGGGRRPRRLTPPVLELTKTVPPLIASLNPGLAGAWPHRLTPAQLQILFIEAIYRKQLARMSRTILSLPQSDIIDSASSMAQAAVSACASITAYNRSAMSEMVSALSAVGVKASASGTQEAANDQTHGFTLTINSSDVERSLATAQAQGYLNFGAQRRGALKSLLHTRSSTTLIRDDEVTTRMTLTWRKPIRGAGLCARLHPADIDYRLLDLPALLWPLYHLIKPMRAVASRAGVWPESASLGPFLGTPTALIPGLLDMAAVTSSDVVVDLGCGDGRVVMAAAQQRGCRARGIEQDKKLLSLAHARLKSSHLGDQVDLEQADIERANLADATVAFLFLPVDSAVRLLPSIQERLAPGARIIMHEQKRLEPTLQPDFSEAIIADSALTVAHLWATT